MRWSTWLYSLAMAGRVVGGVLMVVSVYLLIVAVTSFPHVLLAPGMYVGDWSSAQQSIPVSLCAVMLWLIGLWLQETATQLLRTAAIRRAMESTQPALRLPAPDSRVASEEASREASREA